MTPLNYCILDTLGSHQPLGVDFKLTPVPEEVPEDRQAGVAQPDLLLAALPPPRSFYLQEQEQGVGISGTKTGLHLVSRDPGLLVHKHHVTVLVSHKQLPDLVSEEGEVM